jgi:hypothetical protein
VSELKTTVVTFEEFSDIDFQAPSVYYFKDALGNLIFIHTRDRNKAQEYCDEYIGVKGKYKIIAAKDVKNKSKLESGLQSVYATATRPKGGSRPPK